MKKVVVLSIALIVMALSASQVMAQPPAGQGGPGQGGPGGQGGFGRGMMMGGDMYDQLNLTEEQKKKMEDMRAEFTKKLESATPETRREIFTEMRDKMQSVLTDDQKKKMEELRAQRGSGRGFGGFGGPEGAPGMGPRASAFPFQRFLDQLKLTDEQKTKVATMQREAIEKLFNDIRTKVLTEDQRKELEKLRAAQPAAPGAPAVPADKPAAATKPAATDKPAAADKPAAEQPARGQRRARQQ